MEWKIYKITNLINNKIYIGQTKNSINERFKGHCTAARQGIKYRFYYAIRKHGEENFKIELLEIANSIEEACELEKNYIKKYQSTHPSIGYNATSGGTGGWMIGRLSEEEQNLWKDKVSKANTGENNSTYCGTTDEELINLLVKFTEKYKYICGLLPLVGFGIENGIDVPKSFTKFRFDGNYENLVKEVELRTGIKADAYPRGEERKISSYYKKLSYQKSYKRKPKIKIKYEDMIKNISNSKKYDKNPQFCGTTNETLIELVEKFYKEFNKFPTHKELILYGKHENINVPTGFTESRFGGKFINLIKIVNLKYNLSKPEADNGTDN